MVINDRLTNRQSITYSDLFIEIELELDKFLLQDALRKIVPRLRSCKTIEGQPTEDGISSAWPRYSRAHPPRFYTFVDEVGFNEWVDATTVNGITPRAYSETSVPDPCRDTTPSRPQSHILLPCFVKIVGFTF
jgi:hypothetical protein